MAIVIRPAPAAWLSAVAREDAFVDAIVETGTISAQHMRMHGRLTAGAPAKIVEIAAEGQRSAPEIPPASTRRAFQGPTPSASLGQAEPSFAAQQEARLERAAREGEMDGAA